MEESRKLRVRKALKQQQLNKMGFLRGGRGAMDADREQIRGQNKNEETGKRKVPRWMESMEVKARNNNKSEESAAAI